MSGNVGTFSGPQCPAPAPPFKTVILWFRRDLRVSDNPALIAAVQAATNVVREMCCNALCLLLEGESTSPVQEQRRACFLAFLIIVANRIAE